MAHASYDLVGAHQLVLPVMLSIAQIGIAIGVFGARSRPYALGAGAFLALLFWVAAQDFGGLASGSATDPGSGPLLVLLAFVVASARPRVQVPVRDGAMVSGVLG
jgi:hypothetical protein